MRYLLMLLLSVSVFGFTLDHVTPPEKMEMKKDLKQSVGDYCLEDSNIFTDVKVIYHDEMRTCQHQPLSYTPSIFADVYAVMVDYPAGFIERYYTDHPQLLLVDKGNFIYLDKYKNQINSTAVRDAFGMPLIC